MRGDSLVLSLLFASSLGAYDLEPAQKALNKIESQIDTFSKPYAQRAFEGRLAQARLRFSERNYAEALDLLMPLLGFNNLEITTLAAHCEFELGNYWTARELFKTLPGLTSLYRMVQIEDHLNNFSELENYYQKIKAPPDFVRYIYARQLLLNSRTAQSIKELDSLMASTEYKEKATYLKAVILLDQKLLQSLFKAQNPELAQMAQLASARLYYEQDQPEKAIELYKTLNQPRELGLAQMRAGDMSADLKQAQRYYKQAEANFSEKALVRAALVRQEKSDEARELLLPDLELVIPEIPPKVWNDSILETKLAYEAFDVEAESVIITQLNQELTALREQLAGFKQSRLSVNSNKKLSYELDGQALQSFDAYKIEPGEHHLKVTATYQIGQGDVSSMLSYHLSQTYSFKVNPGDSIKMALTWAKNKLSLTQSVQPTDLDLLAKLNQQESVLTQELERIRLEEPQKMQAICLKSKAELKALSVQLANLKAEYELARQQEIEDSKPALLAKLNEEILENDQALLQIGSTERLRLQKRIAQIEQLKAAELGRAQETDKP